MRNNMYDDDNAYPYNNSNSSENASNYNREDEIYARQYEDLMQVSDEYSSSNTKRNVIIVLSIMIVVIAVLLAMVLISASKNKDSDAAVNIAASSAEELKDSELKNLIRKGEHYINTGDYESAETIYEQILDLNPADDKIYTLHSTLFNYNKAMDALKEKDCDKARNYADKIPSDYTYYENLSSDIDYLNDEIEKCEEAYSNLENVSDLIDEGDYDGAAAAIELVDKNRLASDDRKILDGYRSKIEEKLEDIKTEAREENKSKEDEDEENDAYYQLSNYYAEDLIASYCNAYVESINRANFNIVAPFIHKSSPMYNQQKEVVEYCIKNGITERFDGMTLNSLKRTSPSSWIAAVTESETIYYSGGSSESKTFHWNYTIEYIGSDYYLTKIAKAN